MPSDEQVSRLVVGKTTAEQVRKRLGDPFSLTSEPQLTWIYLKQKSETFAFFKPRITERQVLSVSFDDKLFIKEIRFYDQDDYTNLQFSREVVASEGRRITFWQQMFGNLGNFSSDQFFD
jgi:outer membrane protein assembly factor BamE (lipoprotein component of BamABCDE complex)